MMLYVHNGDAALEVWFASKTMGFAALGTHDRQCIGVSVMPDRLYVSSASLARLDLQD